MSASARAPLGWLTAAAHRMCPGCGAPDLLPGPRGGSVSQNFFCTKCGNGWNVHTYAPVGVIDVDALGPTRPELIQFYLGVADGTAVLRDELERGGHSPEYIEAVLEANFDRLARSGLPPLRPESIRDMLKRDGFTDEEITEVFHFAQIVEPSGNVVRVNEATLPELRGIMHRLFRGKRDE